jgi:predicted transcriptional regulator
LDGASVKIIISRNNPLVVEDEDGHIMYTYQPIDDQELDKMTLDELDACIQDAIRDSYK